MIHCMQNQKESSVQLIMWQKSEMFSTVGYHFMSPLSWAMSVTSTLWMLSLDSHWRKVLRLMWTSHIFCLLRLKECHILTNYVPSFILFQPFNHQWCLLVSSDLVHIISWHNPFLRSVSSYQGGRWKYRLKKVFIVLKRSPVKWWIPYYFHLC